MRSLRPSACVRARTSPRRCWRRFVDARGRSLPAAVIRDGGVELTCRSSPHRYPGDRGRKCRTQFLDINELRGLPWRPGTDRAPGILLRSLAGGDGAELPGSRRTPRGASVELKQGHLLEAAEHFRTALSTQHRQMACSGWAIWPSRPAIPSPPSAGTSGSARWGCSGSSRPHGCASWTEPASGVIRRRCCAPSITAGMPEPLRAETTVRGGARRGTSGAIAVGREDAGASDEGSRGGQPLSRGRRVAVPASSGAGHAGGDAAAEAASLCRRTLRREGLMGEGGPGSGSGPRQSAFPLIPPTERCRAARAPGPCRTVTAAGQSQDGSEGADALEDDTGHLTNLM